MAQRLKTVEYAFDFNSASVATAVARTFTGKTIFVPETNSRTIRSAILEFTCFDSATVAASVTAVALACQIDAVAVSTATVTQTITNSGENQSFVFTKDVRAYFVTNFTGSAHTVTPSITVTGIATQNASCKLILTYEYDDTAASTRVKTVKIPIDGATTNLTTTFANVGGVASQIPALDTFLPEASKVYRDIHFTWITHTGTTAAAASTLDISYDGGATTVSDLTHAATLNSDVFYMRVDNLTATLNTAAAQTIQAKVTSTTGKPCPCLCGYLTVTYEYDHDASTRIMNSIQVPTMDENALSGGTTTADKSRWTREISIQEPGTITLVQSGILATFIGSAAITLDLRVGSQASRTFAHAATARSGSVSAMRRIDSGSAGGVAGMTLARGFNSIVVDWFATTSSLGGVPSNMSGLLFLNYTSDKHSLGDGVHNHTTAWCVTPYSTGFAAATSNRVQVTPATTPVIPETEFWLAGMGYNIWLMPHGTTSGNIGMGMLCEVQSTESEGAGWRSLYSAMYESDAEIAPSLMFARARDDFRRWPADSDSNRLDPELSRSFRYDNNTAVSTTAGVIWQSWNLLTYHAITYSIGGSVTGGGAGTTTVSAYRASDGLLIDSIPITANPSGAYSFTWYDNTQPVFVEARLDGTHIGRSDNAVAV